MSGLKMSNLGRLLVCLAVILSFIQHNGADFNSNSDPSPTVTPGPDPDKDKDSTDTPEPPFPRLFYSQGNYPKPLPPVAKLVTETLRLTGVTYEEEYVNLDWGKSVYVKTDTQEVVLATAREDQILKYKPYTCQAYKSKDQVLPGLDNLSIRYGDYSPSRTTDQSSRRASLRVFGVIGLWLIAESSPKSYKLERVEIGAKIDFERKLHTWCMIEPVDQIRTVFKFYGETHLNLELVEIRDKENKLLKSIRILSLDHQLSMDQHGDIFEVPVGYDCANVMEGDWSDLGGGLDLEDGEKNTHQDENSPALEQDDFWLEYIWTNSRVKLEVTATKMQQADLGDSPDSMSRATDTIYVEIAHAQLGQSTADPAGESNLLLTKIKSKEAETMTILNHLYGVKYHMDLRRGTCKMSYLSEDGTTKPSLTNQDLDRDSLDDDLTLKFSNGLKLPFHKRQMRDLFANDLNFKLMRKIKRFNKYAGKWLEYHILERPTFEWAYSQAGSEGSPQKVVAREMATLVVSQDASTNSYSEPRLDSITVWLLDAETQSKILETYHINVVEEVGPLDLWPEVASLFDVSEECYLNDPTKKSGRDFAWLHLFYPISSRNLDILIENEFDLKRSIYSNMMALPIWTSASLPRMEVMFSDDGLYLRLLILDLPPLDVLFAWIGGTSLPDASLVEGSKQLEQDQKYATFTVPDERHCSKLCQMHACLAMTFCRTTGACILSSLPASLSGSKPMVPDEDNKDQKTVRFLKLTERASCSTFTTRRPEVIKRLRHQRLANVISLLQHQIRGYDHLALPQMPDEISLMREESGIARQQYQSALKKYLNDVATYLAEEGNIVSLPTFWAAINDHLLMALPLTFQVENDPLESFSLSDANDATLDEQLYDTSQLESFFHDGLPRHHFNLNAFNQQPAIEKLKGRRARLLTTLSYDQCSLACLDGRCGSFSYCSHTQECILTPLTTAREATELNLLLEDDECFVAQRDFLQNFDRYPQVQQPLDQSRAKQVESANDCASHCVAETDFNCLSFEVCEDAKSNTKTCYEHADRHPDSPVLYQPDQNTKDSSKRVETKPVQCDHYKRSFLADFTEIQAHEIEPKELSKLKTSEYFGKTTFECADICLNELADCSAFQFCFETPWTSKKQISGFVQSCTMIQSKPQTEEEQRGLELEVESQDAENATPTSTKEKSLVTYSSQCHLFALKPNTVQAHLRDLAMGQTMTKQERREMSRASSSSVVRFTWFGFLFMLLALLTSSALFGAGLCLVYARSELVKRHVDRLRAVARV